MAISSTPKKTGRPRKHHVDRNGNTIVGLTRRPKDGRWRIIGTSITFSEPDEMLAIARFRDWEAKQKGATLDIPQAAAGLDDERELERAIVAMTPDAKSPTELKPVGTFQPPGSKARYTGRGGGRPIRITLVDDVVEFSRDPVAEAAFWPWLRRLILKNPQLVAEKVGIEQIGYLANLPKPTPSPTLEEVGKLYVEKAKIGENWRQKTQVFWREFCESVEVKKTREVTQEMVTEFYDEIIDQVDDAGEGKSATWAKHRFGQIKAVLHFARKRGKWTEDMGRLLNLCAVLVPPASVVLDPKPISRDNWQRVYRSADENLKPIMLMALNCCMYGQEVADVRWDDLDLDAGTLVMRRGKTGVVRVAVLWPETVKALRAIPRKTDYVFITKYHKGQHTSKTIGKEWRKLKVQVGLGKEVQFCHIRDGAFTAAVSSQNVQFQHAQALAGHRTGQADHYVLRRPQDVAAACRAIYDTYMAKPKDKGKGKAA